MDNETLYRHAVDAAGIGAFERDYLTGQSAWSAHAWRIFGLTPRAEPPSEAALMGDSVHPDDQAALRRALAALRADPTRTSGDVEFRTVHPDGSVRHVMSSVSFVRDGSGATVGVRGIYRDVTDHRLAEREARESAELFKRAAVAANVCAFHHDHITGRRRWSHHVWSIIGLPERQDMPTDDEIFALTHPEDAEEYAQQIYAWRDDPSTIHCEISWRIVRPDGAVRHLHAATDYTRDAAGVAIASTGVVSDVTERREAEKAARESAELFQRASAAAGFCVFDHTHSQGRRRWSRQVWALHGLPEQEGSRSDPQLQALIHPDDIEGYLAAIQGFRAARDRTHFELSWRIVRPDGAVRYLRAMIDYTRAPDGRPTTSSGVVMDVTDQRLAEAAMAESESRLRLAVEAAGMGVFDHDFRTGRGTWDSRIWEICGRPPRPEPMAPQEFEDIVHPDDRARRRGLVADLRKAGHGSRRVATFRIYRPDGSIRHIECLALNECDSAGKSVRMSGVFLDVTERMQASEALQASEVRLRRAVEGARLGVYDVDLTTGARVWSPQLWEMHGLAPRPNGPDSSEIIALTHEADRPGRVAERNALFTDPANDKADASYRIVRPDGSIRHLVSLGEVLRDQAGRPVRLCGITMDVTESKIAEEALAASEARFRLAADIAEIGLFEVDVTTRRRNWSRRLWEIFGMEPRPEGVSEEEFTSLVHPDIRAAYFARLHAAWADPAQSRFELENRIIRRDGDVRDLIVQGQFTRAADGTVLRVQGVTIDVTERRRADEALRASEMRFRLATNAAGLGVFEVDARTRRRTWSTRIWEIVGASPRPSGFDDAEFDALLHPEDRASYHRQMAACVADHQRAALQIRTRVIRPDGDVRHLDVQGMIVRDGDGNVLRIYGIVLDDTERLRAEEALRTSEMRSRLATEAARFGVFEIDGLTGCRTWSPRMWEIIGRPPQPDGLAEPDYADMLHPDDREAYLKGIEQHWIDPKRDRTELRARIVRADGEIRHIVTQAIAVRSPEGVLLRVHGIVMDVTESAIAEEALRTSEARFRLAADAAGMGIFEVDGRTGKRTWSPRQWEITGLSPHDAGPSDAEFAALIHPADRAAFTSKLQAMWQDPAQDRFEGHGRIIRSDGSLRYIEVRALILRKHDGTVVRLHGVTQDVTDARLAEEALRASEIRFRLAVESVGMGVFERNHRTGRGIWSARMWEIYDLPPRDEAPSDAEFLAMIHPDDFQARQRHVATLLAGGEFGVECFNFRIIRNDGTIRHVELSSMLTRDAEGELCLTRGVVFDVTERKRAEDELRASELRVRLALDIGGIGVFERNHRTGQGTWSAKMWEAYGLEPRATALSLEEFEAMIHPDDMPARRNYAARVLAAPPRTPLVLNHRIIRADGTIRHVELRTMLDRDAADDAVVTRGMLIDVTERMEAEAALRASEARFRLAADAGELGVFERHRDGTGSWSARMWEIYGLPPRAGSPSNDEVAAMIHPDDRARRLGFDATLWMPDAPDRARLVSRIIRTDGSVHYIDAQVLPVRDARGVVTHIHGVVHDDTARVLAEAELVAEKERFRHAADAAAQGVFERDIVTRRGTWSPRMWEIYGLEPRDEAPSEEERAQLVHPDDRGVAPAIMAALVHDSSRLTMQGEYRIVRPDGAIRHIVASVMAVRDAAGMPLRVHGIETDVTEEREMRAASITSANLATLGQMATGIAHELSQPLQAIATAAAIVNSWVGAGCNPASTEMAIRQLNRIEDQAERAGQTMRHLLLFGRGGVSSGKTTPAAVVAGALDLVGTALRGQGVELDIAVPATLPEIKGAQLELEKVLINLLLNARDAMQGRDTRRITLRACAADGAVVMHVEDTGTGIPGNILSRLFDPFFTTKEVGKGTGLGLSICRTTMKACGGDISVANTPTGARFTLSFALAGPN